MKNHLFTEYLVLILTAALALSSSLLGCGGDSGGGGACGKVNPCGGSLVGDWKVTGSCLVSTGSGPIFCSTATTTVDMYSVTGNVAFMANKNFSRMLSETLSITIDFPNSCLTINGTTLTCAEFDAAQKEGLAMNPDPAIASISCASTGLSCKCAVLGAADNMTGMGTWATAGTKLMSTEVGKMPSVTDYCVQGNNLHVIGLDMAMPMGPMGQFNITHDLVLAKQ